MSSSCIYFLWLLICILLAFEQDIPDVDGDRDFGIQSFSVKLGQEKVSI
jgi:homogentisate phytyltransferase/homogentisate geranylgeranyltransferase